MCLCHKPLALILWNLFIFQARTMGTARTRKYRDILIGHKTKNINAIDLHTRWKYKCVQQCAQVHSNEFVFVAGGRGMKCTKLVYAFYNFEFDNKIKCAPVCHDTNHIHTTPPNCLKWFQMGAILISAKVQRRCKNPEIYIYQNYAWLDFGCEMVWNNKDICVMLSN